MRSSSVTLCALALTLCVYASAFPQTDTQVTDVETEQLKAEEGEYVIQDIGDADLPYGEPEDKDFQENGLKSTLVEPLNQTRVLYTGSQLWKIKITTTKQQRVLSELHKQKVIL